MDELCFGRVRTHPSWPRAGDCRQYAAVRRYERCALCPGACRGTIRGAQLGCGRCGGRRRRPCVRVHDRGRIVIIGPTGRNLAAGMSGGLAFVLDVKAEKVNRDMVVLEQPSAEDCRQLVDILGAHLAATGSPVAAKLLDDWGGQSPRFTKVLPVDYQKVVEENQLVSRLMPDPRGFLNVKRSDAPTRPPDVRVGDWASVNESLDPVVRNRDVSAQASRCMDCAVPYCHSADVGCPLGNLIPEWNDLVRRGRGSEASENLHSTNNFPEFTGHLCPAPCETACVLALDGEHTSGCHHQAHRTGNRRQRLGVGLVGAAGTGSSQRKLCCGCRFGTGGTGRGSTTDTSRTQCHGVRAERSDRGTASLRNSGIQVAQGPHQPAAGPTDRRGDQVRHRLRRRSERERARPLDGIRGGSPGGRG